MDAEHDHDRQQAADEQRGRPGGVFSQVVEDDGKPRSDDVAKWSKHRERERSHDEEDEQWHEDEVDGFWHDAVEPLFNVRLHEDDQQDRDDAVGVADKRERDDFKEVHPFLGGYERVPCRVHEDAGDAGGQDRIAFELLGFGEREQDRQEVENRVGEHVEQRVRLRLVGDEFEDDEQREHGFDHTGSGERGNDGLERAGDEVDNRVDNAFLFGGLAVASLFEVDFLFDFLEDVGDVGADDDLVDAGVDHDFGDAVHRFERFRVGFRFVFEFEAKPGLAVIHIVDVFFSADFFNDLFGELGVLFRHNFFPLFVDTHKIPKENSGENRRRST